MKIQFDKMTIPIINCTSSEIYSLMFIRKHGLLDDIYYWNDKELL